MLTCFSKSPFPIQSHTNITYAHRLDKGPDCNRRRKRSDHSASRRDHPWMSYSW